QFACFMENICGVHGKKSRDAAFLIAFAIHVSRGARSHHSSVPLPRAARAASLEEVVTAHPPSPCIAEYKSTTRHGCGAAPQINSRIFPTASCGTDGSIIMPVEGFFSNQERGPTTRP
ncbi:hypothetical protein TcCL_NonESM08149, partial [Trypanosoma cruzi]